MRPLGVGGPDALWHHVEEVAVALLAGPQERVALVLAQQLRLRLELLFLQIEIDEHLRLRAEDVGIEGLHQVVDRPLGVAAKDVGGVAPHRRDEDDRNVAAARPLLDQAGGLKTIQAGHLDVQQDEREVAPQEVPKRLLAGGGRDQLVSERGEDRLQRHHVRGVVIDQQDAGALSERAAGAVLARSPHTGGDGLVVGSGAGELSGLPLKRRISSSSRLTSTGLGR